MPTDSTTLSPEAQTRVEQLDQLIEICEMLKKDLNDIRWLAAAQDGSFETAQQSLNDIEDIAAEAIEQR